MATLDQTLQIFRALLSSRGDTGISDADQAIWSYLTPIQGLHAQVEALDALIQRVDALNDTLSFMASLKDDLNRHRERLAEPQA